MRTYRRLLQIFFLALILGSASGCAMFQPDDPGYNNPQRAQNIVRTASSQEGKQYRMGGASGERRRPLTNRAKAAIIHHK